MQDPLLDPVTELERQVDMLLREPATDRLEQSLADIPSSLSGSAPAKALRAELLRRSGDARQAALLFAEAVAGAPGLHMAYHGAALAHIACGDRKGARAAWTALLERVPDDLNARYQIALTWHDERSFRDAAYWYEKQLEHHASFAAAYNLGLVRLELGEFRKAADVLARASGIDPLHVDAWAARGTALRGVGDGAGAADAWLRAHALDPKNTRLLAQAAAIFSEAAELPTAIGLLKRALSIDSKTASLRWATGADLSSLGLHREALQYQQEALALDPANWRGHSALLVEMQYDTELASRSELAAAHRQWAAAHCAKLSRAPPSARGSSARDGRTRVGYLSPRFGAGPLANLFLPVLEAHDRHQYHITLYSAHRHEDDAAIRMRAACDVWRDLPSSDDEAAAMIAADGLDLLVDLAGHTPGHRLPVLARKPAPVQATWLDYFDTTGVPEIDYMLSDAVHTPVSDIGNFSERIVWLPNCRFAYRPTVRSASSQAPRHAKGWVTFGSFNRHAKITDHVVAVWKSVLEAVPDSRLELRASAYRGSGTVAWVRERWARSGLPVDRVDFRPYLPVAEAFRAYGEIDVALDTFPYNGGVTTCDALWNGVPVITLAGERMIARQSAAILRAAGHPEWVAATADEYVQLAVRIAQDCTRDELRRELVDTLPGTPLCRIPDFVASLERAYSTLIEIGPLNDDHAQALPIEIRN